MRRAFVITCLSAASALSGAESAPVPGDIGLERVPTAMVLPRGDYTVAPQDDSTPVLLMIDSVKPEKSGGFAYAFRSLGFESGEYRLADYLAHPDGTPATELGDLRLRVAGLLPPGHNGRLNAFVATPLSWFGGYRMTMLAVAGLWLAALPALILVGRKRKVAVVVEPVTPSPTRVERMLPLVRAASEGRLDDAGRAELERLMSGHWRETSGLSGERMGEALAAMRRHPEAGPLLTALEHWLHDPKGAAPGEVDALLAPYGRAPGATGNGGDA